MTADKMDSDRGHNSAGSDLCILSSLQISRSANVTFS